MIELVPAHHGLLFAGGDIRQRKDQMPNLLRK